VPILEDLITHLKSKDHPVKEVLTGAYWTGVVSRGCGLATTFRDEGHSHRQGVRDVGRLTKKTPWNWCNKVCHKKGIEGK
jgi:hypothetical protein